MEIPHKGGYGTVNYNPRRTYCPLVPKQDTFYVTDGSPQVHKYKRKCKHSNVRVDI